MKQNNNNSQKQNWTFYNCYSFHLRVTRSWYLQTQIAVFSASLQLLIRKSDHLQNLATNPAALMVTSPAILSEIPNWRHMLVGSILNWQVVMNVNGRLTAWNVNLWAHWLCHLVTDSWVTQRRYFNCSSFAAYGGKGNWTWTVSR
jgi:hypothetical protein